MSVSLEKVRKYKPIFGPYDGEKIAEHGRLWKKDWRQRYYFDLEDACEALGLDIEIPYSPRVPCAIEGMSHNKACKLYYSWDDVYFDAVFGVFHFGKVGDSWVAEDLDGMMRADLDDETLK